MDDRYEHRASILNEALTATTTQRNKSYGEPDEDFKRIAAIASALGFRIDGGGGEIRELNSSDVALFMICLKLSRLAWSPAHRDSWTDIAGYAACGYETAILRQIRDDAARLLGETDEVNEAARPIYLKNFTGHEYDGCRSCAETRAQYPEAII